jgi:hypothetical protein
MLTVANISEVDLALDTLTNQLFPYYCSSSTNCTSDVVCRYVDFSGYLEFFMTLSLSLRIVYLSICLITQFEFASSAPLSH